MLQLVSDAQKNPPELQAGWSQVSHYSQSFSDIQLTDSTC
jgi:hypothetical protein